MTKAKKTKKTPKKKGPKAQLDKALCLKIRNLVINGYNYVDIRKKLKIKESTWDGWYYRGVEEFDVKLNRWKRKRMLMQSEKVLGDIVEMSEEVQAMGAFGPIFEPKTKKKVMKIDVGILKIKQDTAKHLSETLASDIYNKKVKVEHDVSDPVDKLLREISDGE